MTGYPIHEYEPLGVQSRAGRMGDREGLGQRVRNDTGTLMLLDFVLQ